MWAGWQPADRLAIGPGRAEARLSALASCANEPLLRTWRGHSCLQRRDSSRRLCVGYVQVVQSSETRPWTLAIRAAGDRLVWQAIVPAGGLSGRHFGFGLFVGRTFGLQPAFSRLPRNPHEFLGLRRATLEGHEAGEIRRVPRRRAEARRRLNACPTWAFDFMR